MFQKFVHESAHLYRAISRAAAMHEALRAYPFGR